MVTLKDIEKLCEYFYEKLIKSSSIKASENLRPLVLLLFDFYFFVRDRCLGNRLDPNTFSGERLEKLLRCLEVEYFIFMNIYEDYSKKGEVPKELEEIKDVFTNVIEFVRNLFKVSFYPNDEGGKNNDA